ncbi:MAG: arylesterase [Gammaproteobacteria bacterium]|nr:arylesterase [Gammaproteobacteria bacterium]
MKSVKILFYLSALALCTLLLAACGEQKLTPLNQQQVILAFGDSLTAGVGASEQDAYPQQLAKLVGHRVINAGISGETTAEGLVRLASVLDQHEPQLVILLEGGNDILRNQNLAQTKQNLAKMIEEIRSRNIQLVFLGVPEKNIFSDSADLYEELAQEYQLVFDGEIISDLIKKKRYKSDPIHFNALGYQKLAERIVEMLESNGAL